jgi:hypothetical protein
MGEIADSLINGEFDFHTGEYIGRPVGHPRTLDRSLPWERHNHKNAYNGVMKFLIRKGIAKPEDRNAIIFNYCLEHKLKITNITTGCFSVSANFGQFVKWFNNQKAKQ